MGLSEKNGPIMLFMAALDVSDGAMCKQLGGEDLNLREVVYLHTGTRGPKTYFRGKDAIDGI